MTVLSWIQTSPKKFKPFVSARVAEIQENTDIDTHNFKYIQSRNNPADCLIRGIKTQQFQEWIQGPKFLYLEELPPQNRKIDIEYNHEERKELKVRETTDKVRNEGEENEEKNVDVDEETENVEKNYVNRVSLSQDYLRSASMLIFCKT